MKQLTLQLKSGKTRVIDVPSPNLTPNNLLVKNYYSLISSGTEAATLKTAKKNLIGKAMERPQQVKQVFDVLKTQGPLQTYNAVSKKLEAYSPCGYSSAGIVIGVGEKCSGFKVGDKVACAGVGYANHAEIISVPGNLCVKLKPDANLKLAAYNTLGAIAMQGVRQADLHIGEYCAVIGLGLLGQLTSLILQASGVNVIGIDISEFAIKAAKQNHIADLCIKRNTPGITNKIMEYTKQHGVDSVIITAGTSSLDPINFSGQISRKKGKVIIVGNVPTGFERNPDYYPKELEVKMSCSYGPGRYDLNYEEKGIDYPIGYVRWTEKRNMEAFQELIFWKKIDLSNLTTHQFKIDEASQAYEMIHNNSENYSGIIIKYDFDKEINNEKIYIREENKNDGSVFISFIGAGSYAQGNLLPNIPKNDPKIKCKGIMTNTGTTSKRVAERFNFEYCTSKKEDILNDNITNTVFIATQHNTHADYVIEALGKSKNVFVEKPIAINSDELNKIKKLYTSLPKPPKLIVGFNRRFSFFSSTLKKELDVKSPVSMIYRINAGEIPANSWIQDQDIGGGRVIGEVCHFVDFMTFMCNSCPVSVFASSLSDQQNLNDTININLEFENGSIGTICYYANGSKSLPKEYFEIYSSGTTGIIKDFKKLEIYSKKIKKFKKFNQDKGQKVMVAEFIDSIKNSTPSPISFEELYKTSLTTIKIMESLKTRLRVQI